MTESVDRRTEPVPDQDGPPAERHMVPRVNRRGIVGAWLKLRRVKHFWNDRAEDYTHDFPCENHVPRPHEGFLRAVDVNAPASVMWRWLCQLTVAPYSYDSLDNLGRRSPRTLTPGADQLKVGQRMVMIFELLEFDEGEQITIRICVYKWYWGKVASTYRVVPTGENTCRLVNRVVVYRRSRTHRCVASAYIPWVDLLMTSRQLLNLKKLAEKTARG